MRERPHLVSDRTVAAPLPPHGAPVVERAALVEGDPQKEASVERVGHCLEDRLCDAHHAVLLQEGRADVGAARAELREPRGLEAGRVGRARVLQSLGDGDGAGRGDVEERGELGSCHAGRAVPQARRVVGEGRRRRQQESGERAAVGALELLGGALGRFLRVVFEIERRNQE